MYATDISKCCKLGCPHFLSGGWKLLHHQSTIDLGYTSRLYTACQVLCNKKSKVDEREQPWPSEIISPMSE